MGRFFSNLYPPCIGGLLFLDAGVLFGRLRGDGGCGFGGVTRLCVRCGRADGAPRFARCHAQRYCAAGEERKDYCLDDFVNLLISHNFNDLTI